MSDYDTAFAAASGGGAAPASPYDDIMAGLLPKTPAAPGVATAPAAAPKGTGSDALDAGNALGTGYMRGIARLAGLPVDTVSNVLDLVKAAAGTPFLVAGHTPPEWLQVKDRADVVGSGDNIIRAAEKTKLGNTLLNAANPDYQGGYIQNAGGALSGVIAPGSTAQAVNQGVNAVAGATAAKATADATGNPALAVVAGMSPTALQNAATSAAQVAVRGNADWRPTEKGAAAREAQRRSMEQRITDLKNAGVDSPTLGLASGNPFIGGVENLLQNTPGAVGIMQRSRQRAVDGLQARTNEAADLASTNRGVTESGTAIQSGITGFKDNFKMRQRGLYDQLDNVMDPLTPTNVTGSKGLMQLLNADIPGAPELSKQFKNARIQGIARAFDTDTGTTPSGTTRTIPGATVTQGATRPDMMGRPIPVEGSLSTIQIPGAQIPAANTSAFSGVGAAAQPSNTLPFEAVKKTRTMVGQELENPSLMSDVPRSKWKALYASLSDDMQTAANATGPEATKTFNRATDYTRAGTERLERVAPFADAKSPESAFGLFNRSTRENVSTLQAVKKTLPEDARGTVAGTIIERLGKAKSGTQNDAGDVWNPDTFLTNYNNMAPRARQELFSGFPNSAEVKTAVDQVARATAMMRENSKMWANPSGTGANLAARGTLAGLGAGGVGALFGVVNPLIPLGAGAMIGGANLGARALTSPRVVNGMAAPNYIDPQLQGAQAYGLISSDVIRKALEGK